MTAITYTARRSLVSGHTADTEYSMDVGMSAIDPADEADSDQHVALDGTTETVLHRIDEPWRFTTIPLDAAALAQMREFLNSHVSGEPFTIDPYGTVAEPDNPITVVLTSRRHPPRRLGTLMLYQLSFEVRKLP